MKFNRMLRGLILSSVFASLLFSPWQNVGKALSGGQLQTDDPPTNKFCVSEAPGTSTFPSVALTFRAVDGLLNPIANVLDKELRVSENGQTAVPLDGGMQINPQGLGIDYYIVVNRGNRTDQVSAKSVLNTFLNYFDQSKDQVFIYTDEGNQANQYFTPSSGVPLSKAVTDFSSGKISNYRTSDVAIQSVLNDIENSSNKCQRAKFLFVIAGDNAISDSKFIEFGQRAKTNFTKIVVFHTLTQNGLLQTEYSYRSFAEGANGYYVSVSKAEERTFFNRLSDFRQSYALKYSSNNGASGVHAIGFVYQGVGVETKGVNSYSISLLAPQVTLVVPTTIERKAVTTADAGEYVFDKPTEVASVQVAFPDGFPRKLNPNAALIINQPGKPELRVPVNLTSAGSGSDTYQFSWSLGTLSENRQNDLTVKIEVVDELNAVATSGDVPVVILTYIPLNLLAERSYVYVLSVIVIILLFVIVFMRRQISRGIVAVGARVTAIGEIVRKTIVGGGKRGKPLAALKIVDGPPSMIGQELKIFTEVVKIGRDPQRADMTFYAPDANSSVSGYHARIERVGGSWRIVSVSQSSETFVNDASISSNEPYPLQDGAVIRLGYHAQQPVVFSFAASVGSVTQMPPRKTDTSSEEGDYRKTDVSDNVMPSKKSVTKLSETDKSGDDIFDEFRR